MKQKTILVAGGAGFIGSHTAVELIGKGYNVVIADNLSNSRAFIVDRIEKITGVRPAFEKTELCNLNKVKSLFKKYEIAATIDFAASKAVNESVGKPLLYYRNNLVSLVNLLEATRDEGGGVFVFSSSCTVYGQPASSPVSEVAAKQPAETPYGNTKQMGEDILRDAVAAYGGIKGVSLRYFNPVGAHPTALIGELPIGVPLNLMPYITQTAAGIRKELSVYGNDYNTPDGTCIRDFIHVVDLARAHVLALEYMLEKKMSENYEVFNLGTGLGFSVLDVIKSFEKTSGVKLNYKFAPRRKGDIEQIWADPSRANRELKWKTLYNLDDMTASAWKWQQALNDKKTVK